MAVDGNAEFLAAFQGTTYCMATEDHLAKFLDNPTLYTMTPPCLQKNFRLALVGAFNTGKTMLADIFEKRFGWTKVNPGPILDQANEGDEGDAKKGPNYADGRYIIDGGPNNDSELEALKAAGIEFDVVIYLSVEEIADLIKRGLVNGEAEDEGDANDNSDLLDRAFDFQDQIWPRLQSVLDEAGTRWVNIDASGSIEDTLEKIRREIDQFFAYRSYYAGTAVTEAEMEAFGEEPAGKFDVSDAGRMLRYNNTHFCPVSLINQKLLVPGKSSHGVRLGTCIYSCFDEAAIAAAAVSPLRYHLDFVDPRCANRQGEILGPAFPQLRILLLGLKGSGKSMLGNFFVKHFRLQRHIKLQSELYPRVRQMVDVQLKAADEADRIAEENKQKKLAAKLAAKEERMRKRAEEKAEEKARRKAEKELAGDEGDEAEEEPEEEEPEPEEEDVEPDEEEADEAEPELDEDGNPVEPEEPKDKTVLADFLKASPDYNDSEMAALLESGWIPPWKIQDELQAIIMGSFDQYEENEPRGFVAEVDITDNTLMEYLVNVLNGKAECMPQLVLPLEGSGVVAESRLFKREEKILNAAFEKEKKIRAENRVKETAERAAKKKTPAASRAETPADGNETTETTETEEEKWTATYAAEDEKFKSDLEFQLDEIKGRLTEQVKVSETSTETLLNSLKESTSLVVIEPGLEADQPYRVCQHTALKLMEPFFVAQRSLFITPIDLKHNDAKTLLRTGAKCMRVFGTNCPVALMDFGLTVDCKGLPEGAMEGDDEATVASGDAASYPMLWGNTIIYCSSKNRREVFMKNVLRYISCPAPPPVVVSSACIVGPPCSAKTTVAKMMVAKLGVMYLSLDKILEQVAKKDTALGRKVASVLTAGVVVPDVLKVQSLHWMLQQKPCRTNGWVLDNFPRTENQAKLMQQFNIVPHQVFELVFSDRAGQHDQTNLQAKTIEAEYFEKYDLTRKNEETYENEEGEIITPPKISRAGHLLEAMDTGITQLHNWQLENDDYMLEIAAVTSHFQRTYDNLKRIDISKNSWNISEKIFYYLDRSKRFRQEYHMNIQKKLPAKVHNVGISVQHLESHLSTYERYCPVAWVDNGELRHYKFDFQFAVEYQQKYYLLSSELHLRKFLRKPEAYTGLNLKHLPSQLPMRVGFHDSQAIRAEHCQLQGFCPVSLTESIAKGQPKVVPGLEDCVVSYKDKLYRMSSQDSQQKFMATPEKYVNTEVPTKLGATGEPISNSELLAMGKFMAFMEQAVSQLINQAMSAVGSNRIKYPGLSVSESALLNLSLHLKATNSNQPDFVRKKYEDKRSTFLKDCDLIQKLAAHYMSGGKDAAAVSKECDRFDELMKVSQTAPAGFDLATHMAQYFR